MLHFASLAFLSLTAQSATNASLDELYRHLHAHPELSYFEKETSGRIADELERAGCKVQRGLGRYPDAARIGYGVVGVLANGAGPTILVRSDLDALPVEERTGLAFASRVVTKDDQAAEVHVMHACGHDVHMTVLVGVARALAASKSTWSGTVLFVGQPAEERAPGGAEALLRDGLYTRFPKPDACLALHCDATRAAGQVGCVTGYALANVDTVDITVRGVGGHGAYPQLTKDPIVLAAQIVLGLQTIVSRELPAGEPGVVTVGSIHGGTKHNIIPDDVRLQLTVRSYKASAREQILRSIQRITNGAAQAAGMPQGREPIVDLHPELLVPATYNNPDLTKRCTIALKSALGDARVEEATPVMGGEDFGRFSLDDLSIPCFMFWLGAVDPARVAESKQSGKSLPSLHSSEFAPKADVAIPTGVEAMTACVKEMLRAK